MTERELMRALWLARALRAKDNFKHFGKMFSNCEKTNEKYFLDKYNKWGWAYHKCLAKAKEFE